MKFKVGDRVCYHLDSKDFGTISEIVRHEPFECYVDWAIGPDKKIYSGDRLILALNGLQLAIMKAKGL